MLTRYFALTFGIVYVLVGALGFVPGLAQDPPTTAPDLAVDAGYAYLFGLFPINVLHNIVHIAIGAAGLVAYRRYADARLYARGLTVLYAALAILDLFPVLGTPFGLIPIFGHDVWLHALSAAAAAYFGWVAPTERAAAEMASRA